jgi:hypothetical protein
MTVEEAQEECERRGGDLIKLESEDELNELRLHSFYTWWSKLLRFIPGSKAFFIGLTNKV